MSRFLKLLIGLAGPLLPWSLRRGLLRRIYGYQIHPSSRIGWAWIFPEQLVMEEGARIGHMTICKGLKLLHLKSHSSIGRGNWITGFPANSKLFFAHQTDRVPQLILGAQSAITNRHILDCTASVVIGQFTTVAGFRSQILTHSIDLAENRQSSGPITIGDYCFIGTDCVLLGGSALPDYSVLGAKSLLNHAYEETYRLYGGVPARPIKELDPALKYFTRSQGFIY